MKNYKVPDDAVEKLFGDQTTSTATDNSSAVSTTEATLTDNPSMLHSTSPGTSSSGSDNGEADAILGLLKLATTNKAALADTDNPSGSQEAGNKGTTSVQEGKGKKKKKKKKTNRTKYEKEQAKSMQLVDRTPPGDCLNCGKLAEKICAKCLNNSNQISYYCAMKCRVEHSSVHKEICSLDMPTPSDTLCYDGKNRLVYGILLPELTARPCIVDVRVEQKWNHQTQKSFDFVHSKQYLGETGCSSYIIKNTRKPNRAVPLFAIFYLHDKFLSGASKKNQFVDLVTGEDEAKVWRGPILIIKSQGNDWTNLIPINVNLSDDFIDIIDYFKSQ